MFIKREWKNLDKVMLLVSFFHRLHQPGYYRQCDAYQ